MDDRGKLTGAAATLILYKEADKADSVELRIEPLNDRDISELDDWVRARIVKTARDSLGPDCSAEERTETLETAMRLAQGESMLTSQGARILGTVDGIARLIWQTARRQHPNLGYEELRGYMFQPRNVDATTKVFQRLNSQWGSSKNRPAPQAKRGKKR